jgi:hypothetical protein
VLWAAPAHASLLIRPPLYIGLNSGLVGFWSFNQGNMAGTVAYDSSGNGNNGTLTNGPTRTIGKIGQSLTFNGASDQYVNAGSASSLDDIETQGGGGFTLSAWIYPRSNGQNNAGYIFDKGGGGTGDIYLRIDGSNNTLQFVKDYQTTQLSCRRGTPTLTLQRRLFLTS